MSVATFLSFLIIADMAEKGIADFSSGPIARSILIYTFPLFLGNLLQQLYNAADTLIFGNFLGPDSMADVSSSG